MSYSKLHSSIVNSSLWCEEDHVRLLFVTLLAMCDRDGYVYGSRPGLERAAMITWREDQPDPWKVLMSPDKNSSDRIRAPENDGRRIEEVSGGFRLLNFEYYRGLRNDDDRREQNRRAQEKFRHKPSQARVSLSKPHSAASKPISEAEAETEGGREKRPPFRGKFPSEANKALEIIKGKLQRLKDFGKRDEASGKLTEPDASEWKRLKKLEADNEKIVCDV